MTADPKDMLRILADDIRAIVEHERGAAVPTISPEVGAWFAIAVDRFLAGSDDLEKALGLVRGRGRPRPVPSGAGFERAKLTYQMRLQKKSWMQIGNALNADPRDLQRDLVRYEQDISAEIVQGIGEKIAARLAAKPKPRPRGMN
ncbi:MAG: hypothetical protein EKK33_09030 [Bradyrhizobiaceae bacterium]|nr:MAG: hypothetical protein EKK33_09030 [Bradyrhizobiaceae bacterium]